MTSIASPDYELVVNSVRAWPAAQRLTLVRDVLATLDSEIGLESETEAPAPRPATLARARGLLATKRPAPSDDEVEEMRDERRRARYEL